MNETIKTILNRRSIRAFSPDKLNDEDIKTIIEAGIYAPSAMNQQPWHLTIVQNKELLDELSLSAKEVAKKSNNEHITQLANNEKFHIFYNAPVAVIVSMEEGAYDAEIDCAAVTENMLLAAESLDIGSCWIGFITFLFTLGGEKATEYAKRLGIPDGYKPLHAVALGKKKVGSPTAPKRRENIVNYIK